MSIGREFDEPARYQIKVKGNLDQKWSDWFDGFTITTQEGDETLLTGPVADQCALHGLLSTIRDLGLPLLSVTCVGKIEDVRQTQGERDKGTTFCCKDRFQNDAALPEHTDS